MSIFDKFNETIDVEGLRHDVEEASSNNKGEFKEVPHGNYEVKIDKLQPKVSKNGKPMLSIWFKILDGEYENSIIFYNQVIHTGFGIHMACEMLRSLASDVDVEFKDFSQFEQTMLDVFESVTETEYLISYQANKKNPNFNDIKVEDVFVD